VNLNDEICIPTLMLSLGMWF